MLLQAVAQTSPTSGTASDGKTKVFVSAETDLHVFRMSNREFWIAGRRCGDTVQCCYGEICGVVGRAKTYEELVTLFAQVSDPDSEGYVYTEYGGDLPSYAELLRQQPRYVKGIINVRVIGRQCMCLDKRDVLHRRWEVVETESYDSGSRRRPRQRTLRQNIGYTEALTFGHMYQIAQPGEVKLEVPTLFQKVSPLEPHECMRFDDALGRWEDYPLDLPEVKERRLRRR